MTESKKKTTKKDVVETNDAEAKQPKKVKAKPVKKVKETDLLATEEPVNEVITEKATAADYGERALRGAHRSAPGRAGRTAA